MPEYEVVDEDETRGHGGQIAFLETEPHEGHEKIVELLLDQPDIDVNLPDIDGNTPLINATKKGNEKRQEFQNQLIFLTKNGIPMERARAILTKSKKMNR